MAQLRTDRLLLRRWRESDLGPWAAMNADPEVREHLGAPLTREQSDASVADMRSAFDERGYGWWAVEVLGTGEFVGRVGLDAVDASLLGLPEIVASTTVANARSQAVMRRLGMTRDPADDFDDPTVPPGPLRRCVLYRIRP
ncbi:GNAT family N-acetyltransferase [Streptomyces sp. NPDC051940]|uniref:GNAT family N-acetyltransferase n=1 Tax=Streptomyces sp. NPDC051940 TaxID=3155675 RepID=UPI00344A22A6